MAHNKWPAHRDQYLVDASIEGLNDAQIAYRLSQSTGLHNYSMTEVRERLIYHASGGRFLPTQWNVPAINVPEPEEQLREYLLDHECAEVVLYVANGKNLYTNFIFRSYITAQHLRQCVKEFEEYKRNKPVPWRALVRKYECETQQRRQQCEEDFDRRVAMEATPAEHLTTTLHPEHEY